MQYEFLVLLPPVVVVILAALTKNVRISVGVAILFAGLIHNDFSVQGALHTIFNRLWEVAELSSLKSWETFKAGFAIPISVFLIVLGYLIELIQQSGGAYAYGNFIIKKLKTAKNAQRASLLLSLVFSMDDYFSCLTVGAVMRPITDQFRIARVKLALLAAVLASPLAVLFPLSSWVGQIVISLQQAGVSTTESAQTLIMQNPFTLYLASLPFIFYSLLAIASIWFMVNRGLSFGLLAKHEAIATKTGNLFAGKVSVSREPRKGVNNHSQASVWDFLLPIGLLIGSVVGFKCHGADIFFALFSGSIVTAIISTLFLCIRGHISPREIPSIAKHGFFLMASTVVMLVLIWTLSALLRCDLNSGTYLANLISGHFPVVFLPVLFFITAAIMSATMGSAFGTIGILLPIAAPITVSLIHSVTPVSPEQVLMILPVIGAIISGAVSGNHLSPIADVMFMAATSAGCYHLDLVKVMISFAIPLVLATASAFLASGFLITTGHSMWTTALASLAIGCTVNFLIMGILHWMSHRKNAQG